MTTSMIHATVSNKRGIHPKIAVAVVVINNNNNNNNNKLHKSYNVSKRVLISNNYKWLLALQMILIALLLSSVVNKNCNALATSVPDRKETPSSRFWRIIPRTEWAARLPTETTNFTGAAPYVILHHSYQPGVCLTEDACKAAMRSMQNFHMDEHGWPDIGYSFAVGGDGNVYVGRGFNVVGAHAPHYNSRSIGLLLIGNFVAELPPAPMIQVAKEFLAYAMEIGKLREDYILYGHRQVRATECPGNALFGEIQTWDHFRKDIV